MFERCERIAHISQFIAKEIGANETLAYRAGLLSKSRPDNRNGCGVP